MTLRPLLCFSTPISSATERGVLVVVRIIFIGAESAISQHQMCVDFRGPNILFMAHKAEALNGANNELN